MRGVFTSGVLDAFMKHEVYFPYVVAVSAGALNGLSYMSRQPRRARYANIDLLRKYGYISLKNLITQGSIFDPNMLYERFPNEIVPFDYEAYRHRLRRSMAFPCSTAASSTPFPSCGLWTRVFRPTSSS